jgi:hypothetical protein
MKPISALFRRLVVEGLECAWQRGELACVGQIAGLAGPAAFARLMGQLRKATWVVSAKRPMGGPARVLEYLGRSTHKVAITNSRLVALDEGAVRFRWRD